MGRWIALIGEAILAEDSTAIVGLVAEYRIRFVGKETESFGYYISVFLFDCLPACWDQMFGCRLAGFDNTQIVFVKRIGNFIFLECTTTKLVGANCFWAALVTFESFVKWNCCNKTKSSDKDFCWLQHDDDWWHTDELNKEKSSHVFN